MRPPWEQGLKDPKHKEQIQFLLRIGAASDEEFIGRITSSSAEDDTCTQHPQELQDNRKIAEFELIKCEGG